MTTTALLAAEGGRPGTAAVAVIAFLVLAVAVTASFHLAAPGERLVVHRFGRPVRVRGPGVVLLLPWVERADRVSLLPTTLEPGPVLAHTRDGAVVRVGASADARVSDPAAHVASPDAPARAAGVVADAVRAEIARTDLADLASGYARLGSAAAHRAALLAAEWGVTVVAVHVTDVELHLDPGLLRWADRRAGDPDPRR